MAILDIDNGENGQDARDKINAAFAILNALAADYIAKTGTGTTGEISGDFAFSGSIPTRFITDDGTVENGLLWYGDAAFAMTSQDKNTSNYAAISVRQSDLLSLEVHNYINNVSTGVEVHEDQILVSSNSPAFGGLEGNADFSANTTALHYIQRGYVDGNFIPLAGTYPAMPVTNVIEYLKSYGTSVGSTDAFYIGSGDVLDLDNWSYGNRMLFEAPVSGQRSSFNLSGSYVNLESRKGTARNSQTMNTNGSFTFQQFMANSGTYSSNLILYAEGSTELSSTDPAYKGLVGGADYSPNYSPLSHIQKVYGDTTYQSKDPDLQDMTNLTYHLLLTNR